jgi:hypothetical protein
VPVLTSPQRLALNKRCSIIHSNFSELVNAIDFREEKDLLTAEDFPRVMVPRGLGASEAAAHLRSKYRAVLFDEAGPIEIFAVEHEREFGHISYSSLVAASHGRFELRPEGGEFRIALALTLDSATKPKQQHDAQNRKSLAQSHHPRSSLMKLS